VPSQQRDYGETCALTQACKFHVLVSICMKLCKFQVPAAHTSTIKSGAFHMSCFELVLELLLDLDRGDGHCSKMSYQRSTR
jgi:hypothetical protein